VIGGIITIFGENFANVGLPIFANALKEGNVKMMKIKFQEIARINVIFVLPLFFMVTFNSQGILGLFGEEYKSGNVILILILLGSFVNSFTGPNGSLLLMSGKEKLELLNGIIKFIIAIAVAIIFGRKYTWGIALGLALGEVVVNLLKCFEVFFFYRILPLQKKEAIYLFFIICLEAIMFGALKMFDLPVILNLAAGLMIIVISWTVTLLGSPNESDRAIFYFFKNRVWNLFLFRI
jgi:O-antigen/teichoic acid export membrane protein